MIWLGMLALVALVALAWGWFEAGWVRTRVLDVEIEGLPETLDGLRIAHLSDFHLGPPSRGSVAVERATAWVEQRRPDLVCTTGDLLSHARGESRLRDVIRRVGGLVVLGNHDVAVTRDPFSRSRELGALEGAVLLRDDVVTLEIRGVRVAIAGVDPVTYHRGEAKIACERLAPQMEGAALRILLCHFPGIVRRLDPGAFALVLAGHLHAGQINLPYPGGRVTLAHPRAREVTGVYRTPAGVLHVSPGLGTTFVPFRFFARPEVTELVLRSA